MKTKSFRILVPAIFLAMLMVVSATLPAKAVPAALPANFVLISGGEFTMGSPVDEAKRVKNETQHQVRLSSFYMSKYEVTVAEFRRFVVASGYKTDGDWRCVVIGEVRPKRENNHPVLNVSWNDAVAYCKWLSTKTGKRFRLPTEAEWEYACRAGSSTPFNTGENLTNNQANYGLYREKTVAVNSFSPNAWGLYNMHGNAWEWCSDWFSETYYDECKAEGTVINPAGPASGSQRVQRGGGWEYDAENCRSAYRSSRVPDDRDIDYGFRLVFVP